LGSAPGWSVEPARSAHTKKRLSLLALAVVLICALGWLRSGHRDVETPPTAVAVPAAAPDASAVLERPDSAPQPEERASVAQPPVEPAPKPAPDLAHVRGRCVAVESGSPLAGCKVTFGGAPSNSGEMARYGEVHWSDPDPVVTKEDGRFDITFEPPPPYQHFLDIQCESRVPRTARWGAFRTGQVEDLGDVALSLGHAIEGHVLDTSGAPVPDIYVQIHRLPLPVRSDMAANDSRGGKSDANGSFRVDTPIPPGTWSLDAQARGIKLVSPDSVTVPDAGSAPPVTVVVRRMPSISGVVVDETGAGVPGIYLQAELKKRSGRMASGRTQKDGTFTIYAVDDVLEPVRLESHDTGPCEPMEEPVGPYAWGTTDVRIELVRALSFELTVVERASGAPVEDFSVACAADQATWSNQREDRLGGRHPGGTVTVDRVWHGKNSLTIHPKDPHLLANAPISFEVVSAPLPPIRVELDRAIQRSVRVISASRQPIAGSKVELVRPGTPDFDVGAWVVDPKHGGSFSSSDADFRPHELVGVATTDEHGLASLLVPPEGEGLAVRATSARHLGAVLAPVHFPEDGSAVEIVVSMGGRIAGKLNISGYEPGLVFLEFDRGDSQHRFDAPRVAIGSDGAFESPSLEPGVWSLFVSLDHNWQTDHSGGGTRFGLEPALAHATVAEGETTQVELDGREFAGGTVSGTILLNGAPLPNCRAYLVRSGEGRARFGQYVPDAQGRFEAKGLPPGTWKAGIVVGDFKSSEGERIESEESFDLSPGGSLQRTFAFERRRLVLRVLGSDGTTPLASAQVRLVETASREFVDRSTDAQGRLVLDPAPSGEFRVMSAELQSDPIRMPVDRKEAELDVVLRNP
jgi:hypothetical protein